MICIHCEHQFVGGAFIRGSGPGTSVAMRRCPKCEREFVAPPKLRSPGKVVALRAEIDALRAQLDEERAELAKWKQSFVGHLYVPTADYAEMVKACEERDALRAQLDEEREACARLCEEHKALRLSEIIRARGER